MKRFGLLWLVGFLLAVCGGVVAQQFRISEYDGETLMIEYPPSFDGAYLFVEQSSNLTSNVVWEAVDYTEVNLVLGDTVFYTPPATNTSGAATNETTVPYEITPEYIEAIASGEIENDSWTAGSVWNATTDGAKGFFRILGLSFIDTDGDGVDNVSEYGAGTDYGVPDSPPVTLPPDDGDPKPVPGSVASAPGDWNTPPQSDYRAFIGLHGAINARILAKTGVNGTFTAASIAEAMGAWIELRCSWFYRTETNGFAWEGKAEIRPLTFQYTGDFGYTNHLVKVDAGDPAGLAVLTNGTPVLVNASNPWTKEKIEACLSHLVTMWCNFQNTIGVGNNAIHDESDTMAMAKGFRTGSYWPNPVPISSAGPLKRFFLADYGYGGDPAYWELGWSEEGSVNMAIVFLDNLERSGFGPTSHSGYIRMQQHRDWWMIFPPSQADWRKESFQPVFPGMTDPGKIYRTFISQTGDPKWLFAGGLNLSDYPVSHDADPPSFSAPQGASAKHYTGVFTDFANVLSTISPPSGTATLVMDFDRDGSIGTNDFDRVDESHPFRFWVNEDGNNAAYPEADLEDFFPVQIYWPAWGEGSNLTFKLSANVYLYYIPTTMTAANCQQHLHDIGLAQSLADPIPLLEADDQTPETFNENDIVLLSSLEANTNAQIYVHILQNGSEIAVSTNHFSFSSITNMYRTKNLRDGGTSSLDEPANWPDELTNGKDLVYVHGFNVDKPAAENWHRNIFKRLWHAGSNAKYHGVIWDGIGNGSFLTHFHNSVVNAFATAPWVATYLDSLQSTETVVLGHSLGNMVVSSAICEHNAPVTQYYALDAAVALEAYGDVTNNAAFVPDVVFTWEKEGFLNYKRRGWLDYPHETWAAEWYRLFPAGDPRSKLTFRHKFADIQEKTDVFNFYSSTEDILRVRDDVNQILQSITDIDIELFMHLIPTNVTVSSQCAWQLQEMYKGMNNWAVKYGGGGSSPYTGWSFTEFDGRHQIDKKVKRPGGPPPTYTYTKYSESPHEARMALDPAPGNATVRAEYLANLQTDPLFNRTPWQLFEAGAFNFAGGLVGSYEDVLDYDDSEQHGPDIVVSAVKVSDWLLAKGFPSRTGPMGSAKNKEWPPQGVSFDMSTADFMTDPNNWFDPNQKYNGNPAWHHSDWKNAPYVHVYKLFEKIVTKEN